MVEWMVACVTAAFVAPGVSVRLGRTIPPAMTSSPLGLWVDARGAAAAGFGAAGLALGATCDGAELGRDAAATVPLPSAAADVVAATSLQPAPARPMRSKSGATLKP